VPRVGTLPATVPTVPVTVVEAEPLVVITRPHNSDGGTADLIGDLVDGNRLLMVGDSIFAGTETRYGGEMCAGLEPLGWSVEVAAEAGRFVEFGTKVVTQLVPEPIASSTETGGEDTVPTSTDESDAPEIDDDVDPVWDAAAIFLGTNYNGDEANFDEEMRKILDRLSPRPTLLYTVTEVRSDYAEVNVVIAQLAEDYANTTVIDWREATRTPGVLRSDGIHPGDQGEQVLVDLTAAALGDAPDGDGEVECIRSRFRDDSAIRSGGGSPSGGTGGGGGSSTGRGSSTGGGSSSSGGGSSSTGGGSSTGGSTGGNSSTTLPEGSTDGSDGTDGTGTGGGTDGPATTAPSSDGGGTDGPATTAPSSDGGGSDGPATTAPSSDGGGSDGPATTAPSSDGGTPTPTPP
jgi:hypothetical protein